MDLNPKVAIIAALAWFTAGVVEFSSKKFTFKKLTAMVKKSAKLVVGVALVGRTVPYFQLKRPCSAVNATFCRDRELGVRGPHSPPFSNLCNTSIE